MYTDSRFAYSVAELPPNVFVVRGSKHQMTSTFRHWWGYWWQDRLLAKRDSCVCDDGSNFDLEMV